MYYHIYANFFEVFMRLPFYLSLSQGALNPNLVGLYYMSERMLYPFNTAFKRVVCQVVRD